MGEQESIQELNEREILKDEAWRNLSAFIAYIEKIEKKFAVETEVLDKKEAESFLKELKNIYKQIEPKIFTKIFPEYEKYIAHDFLSAATKIQGGIDLLLGDIGDKGDHRIKEDPLKKEILDTLPYAQRYAYLVESLYDRQQLIEENKEINRRFSLAEIISFINGDIDLYKGSSTVVVDKEKIKEFPDITVKGSRGLCYLELYNMVLNPIKKKKSLGASLVSVSYRVDDTKCTIVIYDNGKGMSTKDFENGFPFKPGASTTKLEGGKGFGLGDADKLALAQGWRLLVISKTKDSKPILRYRDQNNIHIQEFDHPPLNEETSGTIFTLELPTVA
ncbi:MAG: HAMP domain-containing histidine kinase [Candidatus Magasanikbacteria bacterium]|nr:HAMP domain-containing histidine kinase [Candidatus Magasanikbacteria bacterium]